MVSARPSIDADRGIGYEHGCKIYIYETNEGILEVKIGVWAIQKGECRKGARSRSATLKRSAE